MTDETGAGDTSCLVGDAEEDRRSGKEGRSDANGVEELESL